MDAGTIEVQATTLLFHFIADVSQSLVYGIFVIFFPICMYLLSRKRTTTSTVMMSVISFMFLLSTLLWVTNLVSDITIMVALRSNGPAPHGVIQLIANALALFNFVISDGVVVWRARALERNSKWGLRLCAALLTLTFLTTVLVIAIRIVISTSLNKPFLTSLLDTAQTVNLGVSFITNLIATSIISLKAWRCRREFRAVLRIHKRTKAEKILLLLVESGAVYCVSGIVVVVATLIRLPHGTLGDIFQPVHAQLSGLYPTVVLILVHQAKSLEETMFSVARSQTRPNPEAAAPAGHISVTLQFRHEESVSGRSAMPISLDPRERESVDSLDRDRDIQEKSLPPLPTRSTPGEPLTSWGKDVVLHLA